MPDGRDVSGYPYVRLTRQQRRAAERTERKQKRRLAPLTGAAVLLAAVVPSARAATITVNSTADTVVPGDSQCTLREALLNANLGDGTIASDQTSGDCGFGDTGLDTIDMTTISGTITMDPANGNFAVSDPVDIQGPGSGQLTIDGAYSGYGILNCNVTGTTSISGVTLTHGYTTGEGGAISVYGGGLTLDDVTIQSNSSFYDGGGIFFAGSGATLSISNSTISGNQSLGGNGGGIRVQYANGLSFDTVTVSNNSSYYDGGGVFADISCGSAITIGNSHIDGNDAGVTLAGTYDAYAGAGGMRIRSSGSPACTSLDMHDTTVSNNQAMYFDGGVLLIGLDATLTNVTISGNTAATYAGGLDVGQTKLTITGSTVSGNSGGKGGGIYAYGSTSTLTIDKTTIENNQSFYYGGGFYAHQADVSIQNSTISGNSSGSYGGGGGAWGASSFAMVNSTVANNSTLYGFGGGLALGGSTLTATIDESTIAGNTASQGGGVGFSDYYGSSSLTITNSIISGSNPSSPTPTTGDLFSEGPKKAVVDFSDIQTPNTNPSYTSTYGSGVLNVDPILTGLANNGGPTKTMRPGSGSPVINAGDPAFTPPPTFDQRGMPRVSNGIIDMGSVEVQAGTIQLTAAATTVSEAGGPVTITATRTGGSEGDVGVAFGTTDGTATSPSDYSTVTGSLSWLDGDATPKTFTIPITNDGTGEVTESFSTSITAPTGGADLAAPSTETVTILDDEVSSFVFDAAAYSVTEGSSVTISVTRQVGLSGAVSVQVAVSGGTATSGSDYTFAGPVTLSWADGESGSKTVTIPVAGNDGFYDPGETIDLLLQNPIGGVVGAQSTTIVTIDDPGNPGTIDFASATFSGTEGGNAVVTVNRTGGSTGPVNADVVITGGTATNGSDYTLAVTTNLSWTDGDASPKTINIPLANDAVFDPNETIDLQLQNVTTATTGAQSTAQVTITDPGNPGTVEFSSATFSGTEGGSAIVTVNRTGGATGPASADIVLTGGTATNGSDYTFTSPTTVSWVDGDSAPKTVSIPLTLDAFFDPGETIDIALQNISNATTGTQTTATVDIIEPGNPGTVEFSGATFSGTEGGNAIVTVTRAGGTTGPASADIVVAGGTATSGSDYTFTSPTTVSWADGDSTPKTVTIPLTLDAFYDPGETIDIALQNIISATAGTQTTATVDIIEPGNPGTIEFNAGTFAGSEGGNAIVTVNRAGGTTGPASVDVVITGGTATNGSDYTLAVTTTLSWADGDSSPKTITFPLAVDGVYDPNETVDLALQNVNGGTLGTQTTAQVTIFDLGNPGTVAFSSAAFSGTEGGNATVTVNRTGGTTGPISVDVVLAGGGTASGADYTFTSPTTLTWVDGDAAPKTVNIPLATDAVFDPNETINLALQNAVTATVGTQNTSTVTIVDPGNPGTIAFSSASFAGIEGGNAVVTVNRTGGSTGPASVDVTITGGTATNGSDYTLAPTTTLSWADSDATPKTITIPLTNDGTFDPGETITLALQNVTGGTAGAQTAATVTINEAGAPGLLQFSTAAYTVSENGGAATITVDRVGGSNGAVSVSYATSNGTATAGADYTTASGTLNWADGDTASKTFTVPILDDNLAEGDETVNVTLTSPTNGATLGTAAAVLTITDFEPGTISVAGGAAISVNEAAGTVTITLTRTNAANGSVSVAYSTSPGTATSPADFTATSGTVTWNDGDTSTRTITIPITVDTTPESAESFTVNLSSPTAGAVVANPTVTITIVEVAAVPVLGFWMKLMLILACAGVGVVLLKNGRLMIIVLATSIAVASADGGHVRPASGGSDEKPLDSKTLGT